MPKKLTCTICYEKFETRAELEHHKLDKHDLMYLPFTRMEVQKLYQFLYLKDNALLTRNIIETLTKYNKAAISKKPQIEPDSVN